MNERLQERPCRGVVLGMSKLPGLSLYFWDEVNFVEHYITRIVVGERSN